MDFWMPHVTLILVLLSFVQVETPAGVDAPLHSAMTQPAEDAASVPDIAGQIADAAKLIVGENTLEARKIGVRTLLRIGAPEALDRLAQILADNTPGNGAARSVICGVLASSEAPPDRLLAPLVNLVGEAKGPALESAQAALAAYPLASAQKALCDPGRDASQPVARRVALIEMIGRLGEDYAAAGVLAELLSDGDAAIRAASLSAFSRMTGVDFEDGASAKSWWRERSGLGELQWLMRSNHRRREEIRALKSQRETLVSRLVTAYRNEFLALPEKAQGERLVSFLKDDVVEIRRLGLDLIAAMIIDQKDVPPEVRAVVTTLLSDAAPDIRQRAAVTAGNLRISGAFDVMIEALKTEPNARVRVAIAGAIGRLDDLRAIAPLVACLSSQDRDILVETAQSLGSLARRGHADGPTTESVATAMAARYGELPREDVELCDKFLRAMSRIGAESLRPLFEAEVAAGRAPAIRSAAIAGLASYDNGGIAELLAGLLADSDAAVRGAAAHGLGRCGRTIAHFDALFERTKADKESDAAVRDKSWEAAQSLYSRLSADARLQVLAALSDDSDAEIQRRRAALARALKGDRQATADLPVAKRLQVAVMLCEALAMAGDSEPALAEWQDLAQHRTELAPELARRLDVGYLQAAMRRRNSDAVVAALTAAMQGVTDADREARGKPLRDCVQQALTEQIAVANDGATIDALTRLVELASKALATGDAASSLKAEWEAGVVARRDALIDAVLDQSSNETDVADRLQGFDPKVVISRIHARLSSIKPTTSGPAADRETALIALARRFAPEWQGYAPGVSPEERDKALAQLIAG